MSRVLLFVQTGEAREGEMTATKEELRALCEEKKREYVADLVKQGMNGWREYDCLVYLVNDGTISTFDQLAEYGITR